MTDMTSLIKMHGSLVTILKKTEGDEDGYGDPAVTWTAEEDQEYVWIQKPTRKGDELLETIAGNIDQSTNVGYLLPDTVIVAGDILEEGTRRFMVDSIPAMETFGDTSHHEAHLSLLEEGT